MSDLVYCRCGHLEGAHYAMTHPWTLIEEGTQCHHSFCVCKVFVQDNRFRSKLKRRLGGWK